MGNPTRKESRQSLQPCFIGRFANKGLKDAQGNPLMPVQIAREWRTWQKPFLKGAAGFAEVVQHGRQGCEQVNALETMPVVLTFTAQDVASGRVGSGDGVIGRNYFYVGSTLRFFFFRCGSSKILNA